MLRHALARAAPKVHPFAATPVPTTFVDIFHLRDNPPFSEPCGGQQAFKVSELLSSGKPQCGDSPKISGELLKAWPRGLSLRLMHCPIGLDELKGLAVPNLSATSRGKPTLFKETRGVGLDTG